MSKDLKHMNRCRMAIAGIAGSIIATGIFQPAPVMASGLDEGPEVILVTAQKREERLVDVPLSVTAISGQALRERRIEDVASLAQALPGLTYTPGINDLISGVRIRGVGSVLFNQGVEPSVSYVLDGVVLARQGQGFQDLVDIERVEVLRGPQGTLFGQNSTAGVINIVTRQPSRELEADAEVVLAEYGEQRLRASVSGPVTERAAIRLTGFHNDVDGHIRNLADGQKLNGNRTSGARVQLAFDAGAQTSLRVIGDYRRSKQDCCQWQAVAADTPLYAHLLGDIEPSMKNRTVNVNADVFNNSEQWGLSMQLDHLLNKGRIVSISAYREWSLSANNDVDSVPTDPPVFGLPNNFGSFDVNRSESNIRQVSQEIRWESDNTGPRNYVAGLYYFNLDVDRALTRRIAVCPLTPANQALLPGEPCADSTMMSRQGKASSRSETFALFGQADWALSDRLTTMAGARFQYGSVSYRGNRPASPAAEFPQDGVLGPTFIGGPAASTGSGSASDTDLSGKLGLQYRFTPDMQAYATYTRGYKGLGYDIEPTTNFADQSPVRPETVDAYEVGLKGLFLDGRASYSLAIFRQDYKDLQVQASVETGGLRAFVPANAGSSRSEGIEIEAAAHLGGGFSVSSGFSALWTDFDVNGLACLPGSTPQVLPAGSAEPANTCFRFDTDPMNANRQNIRGGRLPNAPRYQATGTLRYEDTPAWTNLRLFAQGTVAYRSNVIFSLEQDRRLSQTGYTIVDISAGAGSQDGRITLTTFVNNLFDQKYASVLLLRPIWGSTETLNNINGFFPHASRRQAGMSLRWRF